MTNHQSQEETGKIVAKIIPELWGMAPEFLKAKKEDIETLIRLAEEKKFGDIVFLSHRIKGAAGSYGMDELSKMAGQLFGFAEKKEIEKIEEILPKMQFYLSKIVLERVESRD